MKPLSPALKAFVEKQELLRIAWTDGDGARVVPVWFVTIEGQCYIGTGSGSAKWRAIRTRPSVGWVIDGGAKGKYWGLSVHGVAEQVADPRLRARVYTALGEKYFGSTEHPKHKEIWGEVDDPETVYLRLKPVDGFGWES